MGRFLLLALLFAPLANGQDRSRVKGEGGRFSIHCRSASLEEILRELAALSPMELWLEEGVAGKRVSADVEGATLKQAVEDLFEDVKDVNYVLAFDSSNPEKVTKIYAGVGGGGQLGREPTVSGKPPTRPQPF